ncbi:PX domain-containing protein EREX [Syzygium oleosum]|uniref:PX domain-containing protein EREX n=1 Tax=Syzygium oleosum TaxID=219896 RepID=UPI0011D19DE0|nr:PX domain-containing protein EREX [Syzygium oleosum]
MSLYASDFSLFDYGFSDPVFDSLSHRFDSPPTSPTPSTSSGSAIAQANANASTSSSAAAAADDPPNHRHDGKSPLPLGMDWSPPPRNWDGQSTVWPHDPRTGWSYCVTIPSWILLSESRGSDPIVFYRVQVGIQSPEGITITRGILRRFRDFLKLSKELKEEFPVKMLPPTPPKKILRLKSRILLEERRCSLEDWMDKLLSDIDISRSAVVANFLELEAAARSYFDEVHAQSSDANSIATDAVPLFTPHPVADVFNSVVSPSALSDQGNDSSYEISELGSPRLGHSDSADLGIDNSEHEFTYAEANLKYGLFNRKFILDNIERFSWLKVRNRGVDSILSGRGSPYDNVAIVKDQYDKDFPSETESHMVHARRLSSESVGSDLSSRKASEVVAFNPTANNTMYNPEFHDMQNPATARLQFPRDLAVALPSEERHKLNRVLTTVQQRLSTAKTDMEDLIARLNQETTVRQFLTTKVKDLEVELETTRYNCKENMQQATLIEKERFTQMQWDMEELRSKCLEVEMNLKAEQEEKARVESEKLSVIQERDLLLNDLDVAREHLSKLHKHNEELEAKSKADVKLLVKEVKSLRSSQSELKQELGRLMREKIEVERTLQKEKQRVESASAANAKLLHECEILRNRLQECSVNFLSEEEDKLIVDTSSPSDAIDLLITSDNRIGLLLAEAQLLAQDVENAVVKVDEIRNANDGNGRTSDDELRKMLTDMFIDNATLRKQANSVIRCALNMYVQAEEKDEDDEEVPLRKTVLSKFL